MRPEICNGSGDCELMELNQGLGDIQLTWEIKDNTSNGMIVVYILMYVYLAYQMYLFVMSYFEF